MSQDYNFWSMSYQYGWCTKEQLEEAEQQGQITQLELNQILGVATAPPANTPQQEQKTEKDTEENKVINTNMSNDLVLPRG